MKKKLFPAIGIIIVTIVLLIINKFTEMTFIKDYALVFIIAAMFFGFWLARQSASTTHLKNPNDLTLRPHPGVPQIRLPTNLAASSLPMQSN